jgi:murein DD-endopeptidase
MRRFFSQPFMLVIVLCLLLFSGTALHAQRYKTSIDMRVLHHTEPVKIGGVRTLYYELVLTNFSSDTIAVRSLRIVTALDSNVIASISQEELKNRFAYVPDVVSKGSDALLLKPGSVGILYVEIAVDNAAVPIYHVLEGAVLKSGKESLIQIQGEDWQIDRHEPVVIGAPLRDGPWVAIYDPAWTRGHRRVIYTTDGKARISGRFAIDFMLVNEKGQYTRGDENVIANWYGYGADVLAVADGTVVTVRNDFQESTTISAHPSTPAERATGNYIVLDIGNNRFVFYEHLKPGSIRVKSGQKLRKGEVIALLGFTGQTTGPHLHFHVANRNAPLGAEGIPFVFERFNVLGVYNDLSRMGQHRWDSLKHNSTEKITGERPVPNAVVQFVK